jgi:hypothetical protein
MKVEDAKKQNPFSEHHEDYQNRMTEVAKEQDTFRKELQRKEEDIREYLAKKFSHVKEAYQDSFIPTLKSDNNGKIIIYLRDQFSIQFTLEFSGFNQEKKEANLKLSAKLSTDDYRYHSALPTVQAATADYKDFIDTQLDVLLRKFNELVAKLERDRMQQTLSQEVKNPN